MTMNSNIQQMTYVYMRAGVVRRYIDFNSCLGCEFVTLY